jgi:hypothetical protein
MRKRKMVAFLEQFDKLSERSRRPSLVATPHKGRWRLNVSPKHSSLAYDEVKEQIHSQEIEVGFEPQLNLIIPTRSLNTKNASSQMVAIGGRVTVSF